MTLESKRLALVGQIRARFGVELIQCPIDKPTRYREDVSMHYFSGNEEQVPASAKQDVRRFVKGQGWQFSRQKIRGLSSPGEFTEYVYLAPLIWVQISKGYHATRRASLASISLRGLLPSTPDRQTTKERCDCEGNIYLSEILGAPADAGIPGSHSAHWWRWKLARVNRFKDPDWVILKVRLSDLKGARLYRDIWSKSGVILDNVSAVPPHLLEMVWG
jgi:hypothetical protein